MDAEMGEELEGVERQIEVWSVHSHGATPRQGQFVTPAGLVLDLVFQTSSSGGGNFAVKRMCPKKGLQT